MLADQPEARKKFSGAVRGAKAAQATLTFTRRLMAIFSAIFQSGGSFDEHITFAAGWLRN